jgi:hypothetical protein
VFGASSYLQLGERPVAAKTGTTNDYIDGWLMGYTPSLAVGVWVGNNDNTPMNRAGGSIGAGPIWNGFMKRALQGKPIETFPAPRIEATGKAVLDGAVASTSVIVDRASGKLATQYTPDSYREERLYAQYHSILHYVDRTDPRGAPPEYPQDDEMYEPWEAAIGAWIKKKQQETGVDILNELPPAQEDDLHVPTNFPTVRITSPTKNEDLPDRRLNVSIAVSAPRGVRRAVFYLDGQYLDSDASAPFSLATMIPSSIARGVHTLKVIVYDDIDNAGSDTLTVRVNEDAGSADLELIDPKNGQTIERESDTYTVVASLKRPEDYRAIFLYAQDVSSSATTLVGQTLNPNAPFLTFEWTLPASGTWALSARVISDDGSTELSTAGVLVEIVGASASTPEPTTDTSTGSEATPEENIFVPETDLNLF